MGGTSSPRKRYRTRPIDPLATWKAMTGQAMIDRHHVELVQSQLDAAIRDFSCGRDCLANWKLIADALNVSESLSDLRICSDTESRACIAKAHQVLSAVHQRHQTRASWTLHAAELNDLQLAAWIHHIQLKHATQSEFERACANTVERVKQALAGNAGPGTIVIEGDMHP